MCGRFAIIKNRKEVKDYLNKNFNINDLPDIIKVPNYIIAPTEHILVITKDENNYHSKAYKWSYQPVNWTNAPLIINIRKESLSNKRIYQNDFKWHRCLIIADSFYEWDLDGQPYRIHLNNKLFTIAGLYHQSLNNNQDLNPTVAIITKKSGPNLGRFQWPVAILAGGLAGAFWGMFPGIFQAFFKVNVVITGIMFNYIGLFLVNGLLGNPLRKYLVDSATNRTIKVKGLARTPFFFLDKIFPRSGVDFGIILAIIVAIIAYYIINKTVFGREIKSVGMNRDAARYAGVNEKKMIIASMSISGLFAGIGGALFILAPSVYNLGNNYSLENVILNAGFDGIPIALLANSNPIGVIFSAIFVSYIKVSDVALQSVGYASEMVNIIISIILYFSAFSLIIGQFILKLVKRKNKANAEEVIL